VREEFVDGVLEDRITAPGGRYEGLNAGATSAEGEIVDSSTSTLADKGLTAVVTGTAEFFTTVGIDAEDEVVVVQVD
jgi:hypothetical protein